MTFCVRSGNDLCSPDHNFVGHYPKPTGIKMDLVPNVAKTTHKIFHTVSVDICAYSVNRAST